MPSVRSLVRYVWTSILRLFDSFPIWTWSLLFGLGGGVLGLGTFTFAYAQGFSYLSDDPKACANCHVMREMFDGWNRSSHHAAATCNDCHTPHDFAGHYFVKAINGWNHSSAFTLGNFHEPIRIKPFNRAVTQGQCLECHGALVVSISHSDAREPTDCLTCHAGVGHGR